MKDGLEKRGLRAQVDTGNTGDIHQAAYKSYHTRTANGYNLQMSCVTEGYAADRIELDEAGAVGRPSRSRNGARSPY